MQFSGGCQFSGGMSSNMVIPPGVNWTFQDNLSQSQTIFGINNALNVIWTGTQYVVVGFSGKVATSPDGITWIYQEGLRSTTWGTANAANSIVWTGMQLAAVGDFGVAATSS